MSSNLFPDHSSQDGLMSVAKDLFKEYLTDEEFEEAYTQDGIFVPEFPQAAQKFIWTARERFYRKDDTFEVTIPLSSNHNLDEEEGLPNSYLNILKPIFAQAYLQRSGITVNDRNISFVSKLVPITKDNIVLRTRKGGHSKEELIIKERPNDTFSRIVHVDELNAKCSRIRENFRGAWSQIEQMFPSEVKKYKNEPYVPEPFCVTLEYVEKTCIADQRCPSSLANPASKKRNAKNPFVKYWAFVLEESQIERYIKLYIAKFDFETNFGLSHTFIESCSDLMTIGVIPRLVYHCAKYIYSIFVLNIEDLHNFIRTRALWLVCAEKYNKGSQCPIASVIIVMLKVVISFALVTHAPDGALRSEPEVESAVFNFIDRLLNPQKIFDSMELEVCSSKYKKPPKLVPGRRSLYDIVELVDRGFLGEEEMKIVKMMFGRDRAATISNFFINEPFGDSDKNGDDDEKARERLLYSSLPVRRIIESELSAISEKVPRSFSKWMEVNKGRTNVPSSSQKQRNVGIAPGTTSHPVIKIEDVE